MLITEDVKSRVIILVIGDKNMTKSGFSRAGGYDEGMARSLTDS